MIARSTHTPLTDEATIPHLGRGSNGIQMTAEEFLAIRKWDRRYRYELINGVVVVSPAVSMGEADPNEELGHLLRTYQESHPKGRRLDCTVYEREVRVGKNTIRRCDRALWIGLGRDPDVQKDIPTIIVEFVSSGRRNYLRDYVDKRREYLAAGVKEYWVISRFTQTMHVFLKRSGQITERVLGEADTYSTQLLPGFELPLGRILAKGVRWNKPKRPRK